ncbi:uncharacterized protein STEHIDRAFT_167066 [Stereum hirsutum FP-91666 SS1]|uniref:uncharacterized protein n=1 Tax=Stereum hirsutum (strain FP-91666) TaxID=721885 RepID=UPI000440CA55|nr:uncharacterized protein STEHIDRAFT_167066 [Stereum hirsutum FP-91666 SS1]EIM89181.1 hypothetical protein STEHIDRAFT_167066 [Stereum hirsutum FP-91666 SS1]
MSSNTDQQHTGDDSGSPSTATDPPQEHGEQTQPAPSQPDAQKPSGDAPQFPFRPRGPPKKPVVKGKKKEPEEEEEGAE